VKTGGRRLSVVTTLVHHLVSGELPIPGSDPSLSRLPIDTGPVPTSRQPSRNTYPFYLDQSNYPRVSTRPNDQTHTTCRPKVSGASCHPMTALPCRDQPGVRSGSRKIKAPMAGPLACHPGCRGALLRGRLRRISSKRKGTFGPRSPRPRRV